MKNCYYGSFVSGMGEIISGVVAERLSDVSIIKLLDGAIIFETECTYDRLNFFCFNNIFAVIDIMETGAPEQHINKIAGIKNVTACFSERAAKVISENNRKIKTFRLVYSLENKPASINENSRKAIEHFIALNSSLKPHRSFPDTEFWFLYRREGFSFFMKRLTRSSEKQLHEGELSPQLAWLLCRAAAIKPDETALDPFCGYGSIPEAALKHFHTKEFLASDTDYRCVKIAREKRSIKNSRGACETRKADVFSIRDFVRQESIGVIVTDPPWGMYRETEIPLMEFYGKMLTVFLTVLTSGGRAIILTGARKEFELALKETDAFTVDKIIPILVSGKKAAVYALAKKAAP